MNQRMLKRELGNVQVCNVHLIFVTHHEDALQSRDAEWLQLLALWVEEGCRGVHHCFQGIVENLAHKDEALGGALQASFDLLEFVHHWHHQLRNDNMTL